MKKILTLLLVLCITALFCSCDKKAPKGNISENSATEQVDPYDSIFEHVIKDMEDFYKGDYDLAKKLIPKEYLEYKANKKDMTIDEYINKDLDEIKNLKILSEYKININDKKRISGEEFEDYADLLSDKCEMPIEAVTQVFELSVSVDATFSEGVKAEDHSYLLIDKISIAEINGYWYPVEYIHGDAYDTIRFVF